MSGAALSPREIRILVATERIGGGLSMAAIVILVASYVFFKSLRTTPNLFLVLAALANLGASVASVMGYDGLNLGRHSTLCQAQAFIFQWFMQADPWWSFAMAVNVYLVFFYNVNPSSFRKHAWIYCLVCYGGPMVTAIALFAVRNDPRGLIYGDAVLWCWIDSSWSLVRIYSFYIPVWICIFLSILIYIAVGYRVFHHRNQLRSFAHNGLGKDQLDGSNTSNTSNADRDSGEEQALTPKLDFYGTVVTEVHVTSHHPTNAYKSSTAMFPQVHIPTGLGRSRSCVGAHGVDDIQSPSASTTQQFETICSSERAPVEKRSSTMMRVLREAKESASLKLKRLDPVKVSYLRTSFIFAFAVLITWIPSSINRLYSLTHDNQVSFGLSLASGCVLPLQGVWNAIIYFSTS
uniref:G-protein coupled receptors family 2 profile 2 domain-containing protein n=1 Tax=Bionectria ochroleuca TaxID=29856 RepID=A0A8H7K7Q3_BIOOC